MMQAEDILNAIRILDLPLCVSRQEIREQYRKLAVQYHPDKKGSETHRHMAEITSAYKILIEYCDHYPIAFYRQELLEDRLDWWLRHFGNNM